MQSEKNKNIALKWFTAFNQHNLENLLLLYAENAEHYSPKLKIRIPETNGLIKGKNSLREWWKDAFARLPTLKYEPKKIIADDDTVFMEYIRHVENEEKLMVCEVLEIKNDVIIFSRVYHS
ncbi:nuclear transport factor 2 family protein [Pigmentibacter ruber]|nr:nuclear transport factor 2 family protein [Pigmentibacter ruber]